MKTTLTKSPARAALGLCFPLPGATRVCIAGTFNGWDPEVSRLAHDGTGVWHAALDLPPGRYEYRLVVDGVWTDPPDADETVENGFGARNAVLHVPATASATPASSRPRRPAPRPSALSGR